MPHLKFRVLTEKHLPASLPKFYINSKMKCLPASSLTNARLSLISFACISHSYHHMDINALRYLTNVCKKNQDWSTCGSVHILFYFKNKKQGNLQVDHADIVVTGKFQKLSTVRTVRGVAVLIQFISNILNIEIFLWWNRLGLCF